MCLQDFKVIGTMSEKYKASPQVEKARLEAWPRIGISLERVMSSIGRMEDVAKLLREDEGYADMYTIDEQIQRASDRLRSSIRTFERKYQVKIEIFTPYSPFDNQTKRFINSIKKPEEMSWMSKTP